MFITALLGLVVANKTIHLKALEKTTFTDALLMFPLAALLVSVIFVSVLGAPAAGIRWTAWPLLKYLGRISYGLYAFHRLCYVIAQSAFGTTRGLTDYFLIVATGFGLTVAIAAASYRFFESPFLRLKERFTYIPSERVAR
jgi:peptidoglycan/LPS O-acetylase OafA/YrhL